MKAIRLAVAASFVYAMGASADIEVLLPGQGNLSLIPGASVVRCRGISDVTKVTKRHWVNTCLEVAYAQVLDAQEVYALQLVERGWKPTGERYPIADVGEQMQFERPVSDGFCNKMFVTALGPTHRSLRDDDVVKATLVISSAPNSSCGAVQ